MNRQYGWMAISTFVGYQDGQVHIFGSIVWGYFKLGNGLMIPILPVIVPYNNIHSVPLNNIINAKP